MEKAMRRSFPIFIFPTLAAFIIGFIAPFIMGLMLSFTEFTTVTNATFVGFSNYTKAFDERFISAFGFTSLFTVVSLIVINVIAFMLALALTKKLKGTNIFRTVFFMPNLIGGIVLGYIWKLIIDGVLINFEKVLTLDATYGFWSLVVLVSWQQIGYMMIIYIAGLMTIPEELNEAAAMDGASGGQKLFRITIPMMMPAFTICTFLTLTNGFKLFDQNLALTNGEPANATEMLALRIFYSFMGRTGYEGVAQAQAVIFFLLVVIIGLAQLRITRTREVQA